MPRGMPSKREIRVAAPEILSESQVIAQTSASKPKTSSTAFRIPCQISSTLNSELVLFLAGDRNEKRLAEFLDAETANHILGLWRDHEIGESLAARRVNPRPVGGIHFHDGVNIQERFVAFDQNRQADALARAPNRFPDP